jgi:cellulose synthase/poly-beta-1,6-N-acetylglucosamine synthase-like glycosyltransferase
MFSTFTVAPINFPLCLHLPLAFLSAVVFAFAVRSLLFLFAIMFPKHFFPSQFKKLAKTYYRKNLETSKIGRHEERFVLAGESKNEHEHKHEHGSLYVAGEEQVKIKDKDEFTQKFSQPPFISILVASYNESKVIERLLSSLSALDYERSKYEVIIVDDSTDETPSVLNKWQKETPCLKVIHRAKREGWKGGALNMGIKQLSNQSDIVIVVDADNILMTDTLKQIADSFISLHGRSSLLVVQGYPIPTVYSKHIPLPHQKASHDYLYACMNKSNGNNWVSRGISLRLYQRNLIEFLAKEKLGLPLPITGSLFAIRADVLKHLGFSNDLCEDWDLTLEVYLSPYPKTRQEIICKKFGKSKNEDGDSFFGRTADDDGRAAPSKKKSISFEPCLVSFTESTKKIRAYFKQRVRVSEGHTRGFRKRLLEILRNDHLPLIFKIELIFMGLRYAKFIPLCLLFILDLLLVIDGGFEPFLDNGIAQTALVLQTLSLSMHVIFNVLALPVYNKNKMLQYSIKDVFYLLLINACTIPAFVLGSSLGFLRNSGSFYRTARNT